MALNFRDIADKKLETIEKPALPPTGTYIFLITKIPTVETLTGDKWDVVDFQFKAVAPTDDVDPDALASFGNVSNIMLRHRFMFNKDDENEFNRSMNNLRRFMEQHVKSAEPSMSINEALNSTVNQQVLASVIWKQDKNDPEVFHANIGKTAPVA